MSQSIRISSGLVPILQHVPNTSSSFMLLSTGHKEVGFPILSIKECRKRAWISAVSNRSPRLPFIPCSSTLKKSSSVDFDEGGTSTSTSTSSSSSNKLCNKYDDPLKVVLSIFSQAWQMLHSNLRRNWTNFRRYRPRHRVLPRIMPAMIWLAGLDPIDGLKVLLDVSRTWRMILSMDDDLYDGKGFDDYGESYYRKARPEMIKNPPSKITEEWLYMLRMLADLNDPFDALEILIEDLEFWRKIFSVDLGDTLNDSEGYIQKEIFALRDLSQRARILVSNHNDKHNKMKHEWPKNPRITYLLRRFVINMIYKEDTSFIFEEMREYFRSRDEASGTLVAADAKLNFDDNNDGYL